MGINQLSLFVRFFGGLIAIVLGVIHQGKINILASVPKLFRLLKLIKPTFTNFSDVWDEFRDLDDSERDQLRTLLAIELDIELEGNEQRDLIDSGLQGALSFLELVSNLKKT